MSWLQSHDLSCELEVDTLYCTHADAQQPVSNLSGQKHFWNHVLYMNILMVKVSVKFVTNVVKLKQNIDNS